MSLRITPVSTKRDMEDFLALPFRIYEDDPAWVPPVMGHQRKLLDPKKGPFFEIGQAQYFLAKKNGVVVGRISAHLNFAYERHHDPDTGFFGFFECVDDQETADALFQAAADWVRERGKVKLHGPLSFGIYDEVGLLVQGYGERPVFFHSYNPPYYEALIENAGFAKAFNWYAYAFKLPAQHTLEKYKEMQRAILEPHGLTIQEGNPKEFITRAAEVRDLFNHLWHKNWGHVPLTEKQFADFFTQLRPIVRPDLINFILEDGKMLAFNILVPDINITLHKTRGKLGPLEMARLFWDCRIVKPKGIRAVIMGVSKAHQWKRLHHALIIQNHITFLSHYPKIEYVDCSLIPESLTKWNKTLQMFGATRTRTFRLYDKTI